MRCELLLAGCILYQLSSSPATSIPHPSRPEIVGFRESSVDSPSSTASRGSNSRDLSSLLSEFEPVEVHVAEFRDGPFDELPPRDLREERRHRRLLRQQQRRRLDREWQHEEYFNLYSIFQSAFDSLRNAGRLLSRYIEPSFGFTEHSTHTVRNLVVRFKAPEVVRRRKNTRVMRLTDSYLAESSLLGHSAPANEPEEPGLAQAPRDEPVRSTDEPIQSTVEPVQSTDGPVESTDESAPGTDEPAQGTDEPLRSSDGAEDSTTTRVEEETADGQESTAGASSDEVIESSSTTAPENTTDHPEDTTMTENDVQTSNDVPAAEWAKQEPQTSEQEKDGKPLPANIFVKILKPIDMYLPELLTNALKKKK